MAYLSRIRRNKRISLVPKLSEKVRCSGGTSRLRVITQYPGLRDIMDREIRRLLVVRDFRLVGLEDCQMRWWPWNLPAVGVGEPSHSRFAPRYQTRRSIKPASHPDIPLRQWVVGFDANLW